MDVTNDGYIHPLLTLLPPSPVQSASDPAIAGVAPSLTRIHQRAGALMRELDPCATTELINHWERLYGLSDECAPAGTQTLRQHQQRLDAKVDLAGGISKDSYFAQLATLGRPDATIAQYGRGTFTCSSACTDAMNTPERWYYWQVDIPATANSIWTTCDDPCGSAPRIWGDTVIERVPNRFCPSYICVIPKYPEQSMHHIDIEAVQEGELGMGRNGFTHGSLQTDTPVTDLDNDYFGVSQEGLCSVMGAFGASLEKGWHNQLPTAPRVLLLSHKSPFGDIKSGGTVQTTLEDLGLGEGTKLNATTATLGRTSFIAIPVMIGSIE